MASVQMDAGPLNIAYAAEDIGYSCCHADQGDDEVDPVV